MSSNGPNSPKFVAIYRLNFYKNKKNWQFPSNRTRSSPKTHNTLNKTFDVEKKDSILNEAFIDTGSDLDKTSKTELETSSKPNLSQQWLENINIWPNNKRPESEQNILQDLLVGAKRESYAYNDFTQLTPAQITTQTSNRINNHMSRSLQHQHSSYQDWGVMNNGTCQSTYVGSNELLWNENCHFDHGDNQFHEQNYYQQGNILVNNELNTNLYQAESWPNMECWTNEIPAPNVDMVDGSQDYFQVPSEFLKLKNQMNLVEEEMSCVSVDSFAEFTRGADLAPHCSEIEINMESRKELDANSVARMSSTQLSAAIESHAHALARLLWESRERNKLRESQSMYTRMSFEEPTHDVGPSQPCSTKALNCEEFVAGSFRNTKSRVVIEAGRPVRLRGELA
ncbi:unnamed protein product [Leptosia nina]|uniref:Uncharacterized protein n=1 Tax=Leptosia nina TaxID=320188 RepID=A0AAV1JIC3_9NEOP